MIFENSDLDRIREICRQEFTNPTGLSVQYSYNTSYSTSGYGSINNQSPIYRLETLERILGVNPNNSTYPNSTLTILEQRLISIESRILFLEGIPRIGLDNIKEYIRDNLEIRVTMGNTDDRVETQVSLHLLGIEKPISSDDDFTKIEG